MTRLLLAGFVLSAALPSMAQMNRPPSPPFIHEPAERAVVSGEDVHMVAGGFHDPDGDEHLCTDWMIIDRSDGTTAWSERCATGFLASHTHLGDGTFSPALSQEKRLKPDHHYALRVRFRDDGRNETTAWSEWSEHRFRTTPVQALAAMTVVDILESPLPQWVDDMGEPVVLAASSESYLRLGTSAGGVLLEARSLDGVENLWIDSEPVVGHHPLRIEIGSGTSNLTLPPSLLTFATPDRDELLVYLPPVALEPSTELVLWISANGSSHWGEAEDTNPDFTTIARADPVPWTVNESGYRIEMIAGDFQLPVAIEPVVDPGSDPGSPLLYVAELYGTVKVVARDGTVTTYAENLLNFDPFGEFPGTGERGLADLALEPETGDLFVTMPYHPEGSWAGAFLPRVVRLVSSDDGRTMVAAGVVLDLWKEWIGPSHQISNVSIGPDRKLYVHIADGNCIECARDLASARGKILRLELSGAPATDNPFYDAADGITATDFVYASGFRNPFGGAWRAADGHLYEVENGPTTDRFARVVPGADYGWEGNDRDMVIGALYNWRGSPAAAPVSVAFIQPETFAGSGFPWWKQDTAYVTESGPTWATGQPSKGKRIGEFVITAAGDLGSERRAFVEYDGTGKATVAAIAAGPDGLYFSDLYRDEELISPVATGAKIFRVRHTGSASFTASFGEDDGGCGTVRFIDSSTVSEIARWNWRFGDGEVSDDQNPTHRFTECGVHTVELVVDSPEGKRSRSVVIDVGRSDGDGLAAEYFVDEHLEHSVFRRIDPNIAFHWNTSPIADDEGGFSVRWKGWLLPRFSQVHTIHLGGSTPARLWIGGRLVIDDWNGGAARIGRIELTAGERTTIRIEARSPGHGSIELGWESESQPRELIPTDRLEPDPSARRRAVRR